MRRLTIVATLFLLLAAGYAWRAVEPPSFPSVTSPGGLYSNLPVPYTTFPPSIGLRLNIDVHEGYYIVQPLYDLHPAWVQIRQESEIINVTNIIAFSKVDWVGKKTFQGMALNAWSVVAASNASVAAIGCLTLVNRWGGLDGHVSDPTVADRLPEIGLPVLEISDIDFDSILRHYNQTGTVVVYITANETTAWDYWFDERSYAIPAVVLAMTFVTLAFVLAAMYRRFSAGCIVNIASVCILIHLLLTIVRIVWAFVIIPGRRLSVPYLLGPALFQIMLPLANLATLLLTLFWSEVVSSKHVKSIVFLERFRTAFLVFAALLVVVATVAGILGITVSIVITIVYYLILFAQLLPLCIVIWVYGFRVRALIIESPSFQVTVTSSRLLAATTRVMLSAIAFLGLITAIFIQGAYSVAPWAQPIALVWMHLLYSGMTVLQVSSFAARRLAPKFGQSGSRLYHPDTPSASTVNNSPAGSAIDRSVR